MQFFAFSFIVTFQTIERQKPFWNKTPNDLFDFFMLVTLYELVDSLLNLYGVDDLKHVDAIEFGGSWSFDRKSHELNFSSISLVR